MASLNVPGPKPVLPPLQSLGGRGSMSRLVCSSKSLLTVQPSHSGTQPLHHPDHLTPLEASQVSTFLSECLNQLTLLHKILPRPADANKPAYGSPLSVQPLVDNVIAPQLTEILSVRGRLDSEYGELSERRGDSQTPNSNEGQTEALRDIFSKLEPRRAYPDHSLSRTAAHTAENQTKLVQDCQFLLDTLEQVQMEISNDGRYPTLVKCVKEANDEKERIRQVVQKEQDSIEEVKRLKQQLQDVKKKHEVDMNQCKEEIAFAKDQIQEIKKSSGVNIRYLKKSCQLDNCMQINNSKMKEDELNTSIDTKEDELSLEERVHSEIEVYLKKCIQELQDKLDYWMNKYENDTEEKANELRDVEDKLATCLSKIQEQTKKYDEYTKVVESYRDEKERKRLQEEQEKRELEATIKIQAWWKGTMQRNLLGPFRPKKGKKASKKKGGKKKGMKK